MSDINAFLRKLQKATSRRHQAWQLRTTLAGRNRLRPDLLALEDRRLMATFVVSNPADTLTDGLPTPHTLRWAVDQADAATSASKIVFQLPSNGPATITLTQGELELSNMSDSVAIIGLGADELTVSGGGASRVFLVDPGATASFSGLTVSGGNVPFFGGDGGGVGNFGTATLADCIISDNTGFIGGGLYSGSNGSLSLTDCSVTENLSVDGEAVENVFGDLTMTGCTVSDNLGEGGVESYVGFGTSVVTLTDCRISGNSGYGVSDFAGTLDLAGCSIEDNGLYGVASDATTTMADCTVSGNSGAGVKIGGTSTLTDCTISNNSNKPFAFVGGVGGGVANGGTATLTACTISGNSVFAKNDYPYTGDGGGFYNSGTATLIDCTISDNSAIGLGNYPGSGNGGGIFNEGPGTYVGPGKLALIACTVTGNSATNLGGGLYNYNYYGTAFATLTDTIIAANTGPAGPSDIDGNGAATVTGSHNLIGTGGAGGLTAADNFLNVADPGLTSLGDFGGPTETMALQPNSPARHAGARAPGVTTDQRGFALDSPPDIGAFQSQPGPLVIDTAIDGLGSPPGEMSLRQAVNLADVLTGGDTITFDRSAFANKSVITLTAGPLELSNTTGPVTILGPGLGALTVSGGGASRVFQVDQGSSATLAGLTITGGFTTGDGGGLLNQGSVSLVGVAIVANSAASGGGLANSGTASIVGSSIDGNTASADGGGIFNTGILVAFRSGLSANSAGTNGGGLYNSGTAALIFCIVADNSASMGSNIYADASGQPVVLIGTEVSRKKPGDIVGRVISL